MKNVVFYFLVFISFSSWSQVYEQPSFEVSNAPSLTLDRIVLSSDNTVFHFTLVNDRHDGFSVGFPNETYIRIGGTNTNIDMLEVENMAVYPDSHEFTQKGDKLSFRVIFPAIPSDTRRVSLAACAEVACLMIDGIALEAK